MGISADDVRVAYPLFQAEGGGSIPTSALQLHFGPVDGHRYQALNELWHSRLPKVSNPLAHRICYAAEFDGRFYAVAGWARPVARNLPQYSCLELRRMAIADDAPKNTASRMIGWMVRDIKKRFPSVTRLVSYQDTTVHAGTIYKAAGWKNVATTIGGEWCCKSRPRRTGQSTAPKIRWELCLAPPAGGGADGAGE